MRRSIHLLTIGFAVFCSISVNAQKITVSGKVTGKIAKMLKEVQFIADGTLQSLPLKKEDFSFGGEIKLKEPQFVEIKSGNAKPQYYYLVPNEKINLSIDKPSLQESITVLEGPKAAQLKKIIDTYFQALGEKGIDPAIRDWHLLLFDNQEPIGYAENSLRTALTKNAALVTGVPGFKRDLDLFMSGFRIYTTIDTMSLPVIEKELQLISQAKLKKTALNIPFYRELLTDLTNAWAARSLEKYGLNLDFMKQRNVNQFLAAEAINRYISDTTIRNYLYGEKMKIELATNGLKNEAFVRYMLEHGGQTLAKTYGEKIDMLAANKAPDLNAARKKAFDFTLQDSTGKVYRRDDFKGKLLFIDFWASWCAPCKAQIPYQKELEKAYTGKEIVFASVSLDKSKPAWLKAVKEEELHGVILHAEGDFRNEFPQAYGIESIPRYMLIDANGDIISDNMMKPQNKKEMMGIFDGELYAKSTVGILEKHFEAIGAETLKKNGLTLKYRQSVVSFNSNNTVMYSYPEKLKSLTRFEETEQMKLMLGDEFFKEKFTLMKDGKVTTNFPGQTSLKNTWVNKIFGFDLFLRKSVSQSVVKFAEDNGNAATDTAFVLKLVHHGTTEKYYINKKTYLLDKVVLISQIDPRKGGGYMESFIMYEDYRKVDGLMIPFKVNQANISSMKVESAVVKPIEENYFN